MGGYGGVVWWGVKITEKQFEKIMKALDGDSELSDAYMLERDHDDEKHFVIVADSKITEEDDNTKIPVTEYGADTIANMIRVCESYGVKVSEWDFGWYLVKYELY